MGHNGQGLWDMTGGACGTRQAGCVGRDGQGLWDVTSEVRWRVCGTTTWCPDYVQLVCDGKDSEDGKGGGGAEGGSRAWRLLGHLGVVLSSWVPSSRISAT